MFEINEMYRIKMERNYYFIKLLIVFNITVSFETTLLRPKTVFTIKT